MVFSIQFSGGCRSPNEASVIGIPLIVGLAKATPALDAELGYPCYIPPGEEAIESTIVSWIGHIILNYVKFAIAIR